MLEVDIQGIRGNSSARFQFRAPPGITAIVGPSGAGKTSLLRVLAGLDIPQRGRISLNEAPLTGAPEMRQIGMVFQEPRLLPHLNIRSNIELGRQSNVPIDQLAHDLGINELFDRMPHGLSGGEKQRVMIARALFGSPKLMLFDEPLSAIDPRLKAELIALVRQHFADAKIPVLYVTHQMDEAAQLANQLIAIDAGQIIANGPIAETMAKLDGAAFFENGITSVLNGRVAAIDKRFDLAQIAIGEQLVDLPARNMAVGEDVRLRVWARDVLLAKERLVGVSARNQLLGTVETITTTDQAHADILVRVEGSLVRARVMCKTVSDMEMAVGQSIFVVFKSASVE